MPFVKLLPTMGRPNSPDNVAMSAMVGKNKAVLLAVYIGPETCTNAGFGPSENVVVLEGVEGDAGSFLIERTTDKGSYRLYQSKGTSSRALRISSTRLQHYTIVGAPHAYTTLDFTVDRQTGILVRLPDWMQYNREIVNPFRAGKRA